MRWFTLSVFAALCLLSVLLPSPVAEAKAVTAAATEDDEMYSPEAAEE